MLCLPPYMTHESQLLMFLILSRPSGLKFAMISTRQTLEKLSQSSTSAASFLIRGRELSLLQM